MGDQCHDTTAHMSLCGSGKLYLFQLKTLEPVLDMYRHLLLCRQNKHQQEIYRNADIIYEMLFS
jgi:hypothetical protein